MSPQVVRQVAAWVRTASSLAGGPAGRACSGGSRLGHYQTSELARGLSSRA